MIIWGGWLQDEGTIGLSGVSGAGAAYDPGADSWRMLPDAPIAARGDHLTTWTGDTMLVWGGFGSQGPLKDGAAYDPARNAWRLMAAAPREWQRVFRNSRTREDSATAWTGSEWVIAQNGRDGVVRSAAYDPKQDTWRELPAASGSDTEGIELAWTGSELVLSTFEGLSRLGADVNSWTSIAETPANLPVFSPMTWAGNRLFALIHRFAFRAHWAFVATWDPATDTWAVLPQPPMTLAGATLFWDGEHLTAFGSDLAYDVASETWWEVPMASDREDAVTVWTGTQVIQWGGWECGLCPSGVFDEGMVYTPSW